MINRGRQFCNMPLGVLFWGRLSQRKADHNMAEKKDGEKIKRRGLRKLRL